MAVLSLLISLMFLMNKSRSKVKKKKWILLSPNVWALLYIKKSALLLVIYLKYTINVCKDGIFGMLFFQFRHGVHLTCKTPGHLLFTMYGRSSEISEDSWRVVKAHLTAKSYRRISRDGPITREWNSTVIPLRRSPKISAGIPSDPQRNNKGPLGNC